MTENVQITWDLPTIKADGEVLLLNEIEETIVSLHVDNPLAPWTEMGRVKARDTEDNPVLQTFTTGDVDTGDWEYRLEVVNIAGKVGNPFDKKFSVISDAAPDLVTNVVITKV